MADMIIYLPNFLHNPFEFGIAVCYLLRFPGEYHRW